MFVHICIDCKLYPFWLFIITIIFPKTFPFKAWKAGKCTRASYNTAKRISRRVVHHARHEADKVVYEGIDHKSSDIFRLANQIRKENVDVIGDKPVKNDTGEMSMSEEAKQNAWAKHYERLLNVEFDWDPDHLSNEPPLEGPPIPITIDMVKKAISKMKLGKAAGPSGIVVEMIKAAGDTGADMIRDLATALSVMARSQLTGRKVSLSAFTRARVMLWIEATIEASS